MLQVFQEKFKHLNHQVNNFLLFQKLDNHEYDINTYVEYLGCLSKDLNYLNKSFNNIKCDGAWLIDGFSNKFNKAIFEDFFRAKPHFDLLR